MNNPGFPGRPGLSRGAPQPPPGRAGRPFRPKPATANPLPIIFGAGGAILAIVLIFVAMSGGKQETAPIENAPPPPPAAPKPVDVSSLERDGYKFCDEGLAIIRAQEGKLNSSVLDSLPPDQKHQLKLDLKKGIDLIQKGMSYLDDANQKSGHTYELNSYIQARKLASQKYHELQ